MPIFTPRINLEYRGSLEKTPQVVAREMSLPNHTSYLLILSGSAQLNFRILHQCGGCWMTSALTRNFSPTDGSADSSIVQDEQLTSIEIYFDDLGGCDT